MFILKDILIENTIETILLIIGHIIALIGALGFNEFMLVYCWDLAENTEMEIDYRAQGKESNKYLADDKFEPKKQLGSFKSADLFDY